MSILQVEGSCFVVASKQRPLYYYMQIIFSYIDATGASVLVAPDAATLEYLYLSVSVLSALNRPMLERNCTCETSSSRNCTCETSSSCIISMGLNIEAQ